MKKMIKFVKGKKEDENSKVISIESKKQSFEKPEDLKEDDFLTNDKSITKVHKAVWNENTDKLKNIIKTHDIDITDKLDRTALYFAVLKNNASIVELLLENNANQNIPDIDGVTPFLKSIQLCSMECVVTLLKHGADLKRTDKDLNSCLHYAVTSGQPDILTLLLDQGIDSNPHNILGECPIHVGARIGDAIVTDLLLLRGAGVNAVDCRGTTPVMLAAEAGHMDVVTLLYQRNADLNMKDSQGKTTVDYAIASGCQDIITKLITTSLKTQTNLKTETKTSDSDTWNDSPVSTPIKPQNEKQLAQIAEQFLQEEIDISEKSESDVSVRKSENASPQSGVIPPPCKPLRSLEYLQSGVRPQAPLLTLGTVRTRHISMTESEHSKCNTPHRYSYQGDLHVTSEEGVQTVSRVAAPDLVAYCGESSTKSRIPSRVECDSTIQSDWGSSESLPLDDFSVKKDIKIITPTDSTRDSTFLQKQFSILENYEKNHSRTCSVTHEMRQTKSNDEGSDSRLEDIVNQLEDNNRINTQLERYAGQSDILLMAKKSRSLPRNCQPVSSYHTGSMSLPRTLDSGKELIRDMKRYGSFRPKAHFFSKSKSESITSSKKHGFIDKLKNMFGKKSQIHLSDSTDTNQTWLHANKPHSCGSKQAVLGCGSERHSYSEKMRTRPHIRTTPRTHPHDVDATHANTEFNKDVERKATPLGSMNLELGHSRKSSSSRSFSDNSNLDTSKQEDDLRTDKFPVTSMESYNKLFCSDCSNYMGLRLDEAKQTIDNKEKLVKLMKEQLSQMEDRNIKSISETQEVTFKYYSAIQELHNLKEFAKKYEEEVLRLVSEKNSRKECRCTTSAATITEEPDKWKLQYELEAENNAVQQKNLESLTQENKMMEQHLSELQLELHDSKKRLGELEGLLAQAKVDADELITNKTEELKKESQTALESLQQENEKLDTELKKIKVGYDKLQGIYSETEKAFNESVDEHGSMLSENESLKGENKCLNYKLCQIAKQVVSIKGSAVMRNKVLRTQLKKNNIPYNRCNSKTSIELTNIYFEEPRVVLLSNEPSTELATVSCTSSKTVLGDCLYAETIQEVMSQIEQLNDDYSDMHLKLQEADLHKSLALMENENDTYKEKLDEQKELVSQLERYVEELKEENCEGCIRIEEILEENEQLKKGFEEMLTEIEFLRNDLKMKTTVIKQQECNIARFIHEAQRSEQNVKDLEDKLHLLQIEHDKKCCKITALEISNSEFTRKIQDFEDNTQVVNLENVDLKATISNLKAEKLDYVEKLQKAKDTITKLETNFALCLESIEKLQSTNNILKQATEEITNKYNNIEKENVQKVENFKNKIELLDSENNTLKKNVEENKQRCDSLVAKVESLTFYHQNETVAKNARYDELKQENTKIVDELNELHSKIKAQQIAFQQEIDNKEQLYNKLQNDTESLKINPIEQDSSKDSIESKSAIEILCSILHDNLEEIIAIQNRNSKLSEEESLQSLNKIASEIYSKLSCNILPSSCRSSNDKCNFSCMSTTCAFSRKKSASKIPTRLSPVPKKVSVQTPLPEIGEDSKVQYRKRSIVSMLDKSVTTENFIGDQICSQDHKTISLPNLKNVNEKNSFNNFEKDIKSLFENPVPNQDKNSTEMRKVSSLDCLLSEQSKDDIYQQHEKKWNEQLEIIHTLRAELQQVSDKLEAERVKRQEEVKEGRETQDADYKNIIASLQKQVSKLQAKANAEGFRNLGLESELSTLKGNMVVIDKMEKEISKLRTELEMERVARIREFEIAKVKKEEELLEYRQKLKNEFLVSKQKLLADLTIAQNALQAKNKEEMDLKRKCAQLTKEVTLNLEARKKKLEEASYQRMRTRAMESGMSAREDKQLPSHSEAVTVALCALPPQRGGGNSVKEQFRAELDSTIRRHRLQSDPSPLFRSESDEELANKYLLK